MDKMHAIWKKVKGDWSRAHSRYRLLKRQRRRRREWRKKRNKNCERRRHRKKFRTDGKYEAKD